MMIYKEKEGLVMKSTGSWYHLRDTDTGHIYKGRLRGKFKLKGKGITNPIAVGDSVTYEVEDVAENVVCITDIKPRINYIIRKSVHRTGQGHIIAANLDQALLIASLVSPRTSLGFIDRFLVSAESFRIPAKVVFNKADLLDPEAKAYQQYLIKIYEKAGYPCLVTSTVTGEGVEALEQILQGKKTLLSGHSGVGKSSLVNKIAPYLDLQTNEISSFANKGVHTTTFAEMFELEENTFLIDTPGIKELGIMEIADEELGHYFPEMRDLLGQCKYNNCKHIFEPGCAVKQAVEAGTIAMSRYQSYLSIIGDEDNRK